MKIRVELFVKDSQKSVDFYTRTFGFKQVQLGNNPFMVQRDDVIIGFGYISNLSQDHYFQPEMTTQRKGLGVEIVLEVEDIEKEYGKVQASGYPIAEELKKQEWGLTDFRLVDPDGYYLRITSKEYTN